MKKVGNITAPEQQLCYAHIVQLAVLDDLYKRTSINSHSAKDQSAAAEDQSDAFLEAEDEQNDCDDANGDFEQGMEVVPDIDSYDVIADLSGEYQEECKMYMQ